MIQIIVHAEQVERAREYIRSAANADAADAGEVLKNVLLSIGVGLSVQDNTTPCGHASYGRAGGAWRCGRMNCENYYMRHWTRNERDDQRGNGSAGV